MVVEGKNQTLFQAYKETTGFDGDAYSRAILGELGNATELDDPDAMIGLNTYLRTNGYDEELESMIIAGGLFPEKPEWYGTLNADRMRMVGRDPEKDGEGLSRLAQVSHEIAQYEAEQDEGGAAEGWEAEADWLEQHHEDHIEGQMNSWGDIKTYTERVLRQFLDGLDLEKIDYCMGEEDFDFNRKEKEKKKLSKLMQKVNEYKETLDDEYETVEERVTALRDRFDEDSQSYDVLMTLHNSLSSHLNNNMDPDVEEYYDRILDRRGETLFEGLSAERKEEFYELFDGIKDDKKEYWKIVDKKKEYWGEVQELEDLLIRKEDIKDSLAKLEREEEEGPIARFTRQYAIENEDAGDLYMLVKRELTRDIFDVFPEEHRDHLETHISRYATVEDIDYEGTYLDEDGAEASVEGTVEEAEFEMFGDTMVIHNTKFRSNTTTLHGLKEAEQEIIYRNMIQDIMKDAPKLPKTVMVPHGSAGLSVTRVNVTPGGRPVDGRYREDPEIVSVLTLPSYQSIDELIAFKNRGVSVTNTKRIDKLLHDSGAVIETMLDNGEVMHEVIHHTSLSMLGEKTRELWQYDEDSEEYAALKQEIEEMCARPIFGSAPVADVHYGTSNMEGVPSNYERADRTANFLVTVGDMIDELRFSELGDGTKDFTEMAKQVEGDLPNVFRNRMADAAEAFNYDDYNDPETFLEDTLRYAFDDLPDAFTKNLEQLPYPNEEKQYRAAEELVKRLVTEIKPYFVANVSGNHLSNNAGGDEAHVLRDKVQKADPELTEENGRLIMADSMGTKHGGFGNRKDPETGKVHVYQHRVSGGKHPNKNIPRHIKESNLEGDHFHFNHIHTHLGGMVNGKFYDVNPPEEGPTPYALVNGFGTPVYGTLITYQNHAPEDHPASDLLWGAFHHVNDDVLERPEYVNDELDDAHAALKDSIDQALGDLYDQAREEALQELE